MNPATTWQPSVPPLMRTWQANIAVSRHRLIILFPGQAFALLVAPPPDAALVPAPSNRLSPSIPQHQAIILPARAATACLFSFKPFGVLIVPQPLPAALAPAPSDRFGLSASPITRAVSFPPEPSRLVCLSLVAAAAANTGCLVLCPRSPDLNHQPRQS
jgi:hypothetical protein